MRGDGAADGADADANAAIVEVGDDRFKGRCSLLDGRLEAVPMGKFGHGRGATGRRPKAPGVQGWLIGRRDQGAAKRLLMIAAVMASAVVRLMAPLAARRACVTARW